uniref:U11/U12 small nuclear ribonucleoprotein 48 kDa protein isoform X1 n=1 Tax=Rhizophora mucronata TaxID=61149 RepID=A0A2P2IQL4_RHIMU
MPPESLFLHSLHCPSPLSQDPSSLLSSLHYPKTLSLQKRHKSVSSQSIFQDPTKNGLSISLDDYYSEFGSNFFYKDCPGVVSLNDLDSSKRAFTLPGVLLTECADFVGSSNREVNDFDQHGFEIFPSDLWAIRIEVDGWADFPSEYSYSVFCAILRSNLINVNDLKRWVIVGSLCYGVVVDVYVRDHISVLFWLGLKAIRREALGLAVCDLEAKISGFKCPVLVQVLAWTASQLSVLYGEGNAKSFAVNIFRQCVLEATNKVLFLPLEPNMKDSSRDLESNGSDIRDVELKDPLEGGAEWKASEAVNTSVDMIFVFQVAGAVAALHERSLLEAQLKALRGAQSLPRYQRMAEHSYVSQRGDEERKKRPNYRAIIEHDGLLRKQSSEQATSKSKTREELLAEERDYKRRRMSYRGKKLKRTTLQVMRDIIDEYMVEIKQSGGIGCYEKGAEEEGLLPEFFPGPNLSMSDHELKKSSSDYSKDISSASTIDYKREGQSQHGYHEHLEYRSSSRDRHGRDSKYGSPERRGHGHSSDRGSYLKERYESSRTKRHEKRTSSRSNYLDYESSKSASFSTNNARVQSDYKKSDARNRHHRTSYDKHASNELTENAFEDRYYPTGSHYTHEEDMYTSREYVR